MRPALIAASVALVAVWPGAAVAAVRAECRPAYFDHERYELAIGSVTDDDGNGPIFGCRRGSSKPVRLYFHEDGITTDLEVFRRFGARQAIGFRYGADESGGYVAGWWDVRARKAVFAELSFGRADFAPNIPDIAVGPGGEIAVAAEHENAQTGDQDGWQLIHRPYADGRFGAQKRIGPFAIGDMDPQTLAVDGKVMRWRTQGELRTVAAPPHDGKAGGPAAVAAPKVRCSQGDTLYGDDQARIFRVRRPASRRGVYACRRVRRPRAVRIARAGVLLRLIERRGERIGFHIPPGPGMPGGAVGWFGAASGRAAVSTIDPRPDGSARAVSALALDPRTGGIAYVAEDPTDASRVVVAYSPSDGRRLGPAQALAQPTTAEIEPHTLATRDAKVNWRLRGDPRTATRP